MKICDRDLGQDATVINVDETTMQQLLMPYRSHWTMIVWNIKDCNATRYDIVTVKILTIIAAATKV